MKQIKEKYNKGYTLLFAVLVSAITLSVGISILTISKKEFLLSSTARDSSYAFYAADSGLECAWYHEFDYSAGNLPFDTGQSSYPKESNGELKNSVIPSSVSCGYRKNIYLSVEPITIPNITISDLQGLPPPGKISFNIPFGSTYNSACAYVEVTKSYRKNGNLIVPSNKFESRGYNVGLFDNGSGFITCQVASVKKVERALRLTY